MESVIYEKGRRVGSICMEPEGLYWLIQGRLEETGGLCRLYGIRGWDSVYLGIPNEQGFLQTRIPRKQLAALDCALAVTSPRGPWLPWRGMVGEILLEDCYIQKQPEGFRLALPQWELEKLPIPAESLQREQVYDRELLSLPLSADGSLPQIEIENGGTENETNDYSDLDPFLLADLPADYSYGTDESGEAGDEIHRGEADSDYLR